MTYQDNPFPGLRPFESHESALFFGRDEQCDELLARLARGRLVAVVGASGSGKSSLVRAGLLPALQRGYLPSAGSSWQIAVFRPGANPIVNLIEGLLAGLGREVDSAGISRAELSELLGTSSLGLVAAARRLLAGSQQSLVVLVDQFEEIFRFRDLASGTDAEENAVECVNLLLSAAAQDDVPIYVILTMRSDYLGDCARFAGLPEALNDSQFLVPHMSREQLRAAIEGPVAVGGGRIAPGLVQRLLHDVDTIAGRMVSAALPSERSGDYDHDQLPVLQHALMRMWEVSREARASGRMIDLECYESPPVETIHHALDRHADEIYAALPSDEHRAIARLVFQRLTDRDAEHREVRRPTPLSELEDVAVGAAPTARRAATPAAVRAVVSAFAASGRAFVIVNAQHDVDIAHESLIRKWQRLGRWLQEEARSRRIYLRLAETAAHYEQNAASLYRGPELAEADRWWKSESPSVAWAQRYDPRLEATARFLARSRFRRTVWLSAVAAGAIIIIGVSVIMTVLFFRAQAAEASARASAARAISSEERALASERESTVARNEAREQSRLLKEKDELLSQAGQAAAAGNQRLAESLRSAAALRAVQANQKQVFTPAETNEMEGLRKAASDSTAEAKSLRSRAETAEQQVTRATNERDKLQIQVDTLLKASTRTNTADERDGGNERRESAATIAKLEAEVAALNVRLSDSAGAAIGSSVADLAALFESGVRSYDLRNFVMAVRLLKDVTGRQTAAKSLPKEVRMSGTRLVEYAPHAYLAATLFDMKSDCSVIVPSLKESQTEARPREIQAKLQAARKQCGLAP